MTKTTGSDPARAFMELKLTIQLTTRSAIKSSLVFSLFHKNFIDAKNVKFKTDKKIVLTFTV